MVVDFKQLCLIFKGQIIWVIFGILKNDHNFEAVWIDFNLVNGNQNEVVIYLVNRFVIP